MQLMIGVRTINGINLRDGLKERLRSIDLRAPELKVQPIQPPTVSFR